MAMKGREQPTPTDAHKGPVSASEGHLASTGVRWWSIRSIYLIVSRIALPRSQPARRRVYLFRGDLAGSEVEDESDSG